MGKSAAAFIDLITPTTFRPDVLPVSNDDKQGGASQALKTPRITHICAAEASHVHFRF